MQLPVPGPSPTRVSRSVRACLAPACASALLSACGDYGKPGASATYGADTNGATDGTGGGDTDGQPGTTSGGDPPPETEDEGDFRVPRASGKYVYSASETTNSVAVIDTATLVIDVVAVGQQPTVVQPLPNQPGDAGAVVVLDIGSRDIALLRTGETGHTAVTIIPITAGANNLAVSPGGNYVFAYHDVDGPPAPGAGSDQELTVLDVAGATPYRMTVGAHPRAVVFAPDDSTAWVITAAGVNVIDFADLGAVGKPPLLPVVADPGIDPATLEVQVAAAQGIALARVDGQPWVAVTRLDDGELTVVDLPGVPTDLDIAATGEFALLTLPGLTGSRFLEMPLPLGPGQFIDHPVDGEYVGLASIAPTGDALLLYTTVNPLPGTKGPPPAGDLALELDAVYASTTDTTGTSGTTGTTGELIEGDPRQRITLARRDGDSWKLVTLFVDIPVTSVGLAPDSRSAILVHGQDPAAAHAPWSYSLFDLTPAFPLLKRQTTEAPPGPILFTPEGDRAAVLLRDDAAGVRKADLVDLDTFIVRPLALGSPPEGAGYVEPTEKIFVSQAHPTGRITFIDPAGAVQTVTGYVLNDSVKD